MHEYLTLPSGIFMHCLQVALGAAVPHLIIRPP